MNQASIHPHLRRTKPVITALGHCPRTLLASYDLNGAFPNLNQLDAGDTAPDQLLEGCTKCPPWGQKAQISVSQINVCIHQRDAIDLTDA